MAYTQGEIVNRILNNIDSKYDKSDGEFIYDIASAIAKELVTSYENLDSILDKGFADTAKDKNLERIVAEVGIERKHASKSNGYVTIIGNNGSKIIKGEKVSSDEVNFTFLENTKIENKTVDVLVECEKVGTVGNLAAGAIKYFPKTLEGLQRVSNKEAFINGYDEENDEDLRKRYYVKVRTPATSGNIYHYKNWTMEVTGVGDCRILPLWNGNGTVKVIIINSNKVCASSDLVEKVTENIENNRPIGADVTVVSAIKKEINIKFNLEVEEGYEKDVIKEQIENTLIGYLKEIAFNKDYVSTAKIGAYILDTKGVKDYTGLTVNGGADNISISNEEVAVLGGVSIG
ncbi:TPA: baseplate J/gp47 family protein [Clostridium botulinum]|nr:baseplate J/gp47 family protein [Clostridium botulinum]